MTTAATQGTVTLTGKVPQACNIIVTTEAGATNIADISQAATDVLIATVNESCNDPQGYTVSVAGTHSGDHTGVFREPGGDEHPFTLKYGGVAVSAVTVTDVNTPGINLKKQVRISYSTDATLTPTARFWITTLIQRLRRRIFCVTTRRRLRSASMARSTAFRQASATVISFSGR